MVTAKEYMISFSTESILFFFSNYSCQQTHTSNRFYECLPMKSRTERKEWGRGKYNKQKVSVLDVLPDN